MMVSAKREEKLPLMQRTGESANRDARISLRRLACLKNADNPYKNATTRMKDGNVIARRAGLSTQYGQFAPRANTQWRNHEPV